MHPVRAGGPRQSVGRTGSGRQHGPLSVLLQHRDCHNPYSVKWICNGNQGSSREGVNKESVSNTRADFRESTGLHYIDFRQREEYRTSLKHRLSIQGRG